MKSGNGIALIAEDQFRVRMITADLLELAGFRVLEAPNTANTLALLQRGPQISLVVADISLPEGEVLASGIKRCCPEVKLLLLASCRKPPPEMLPQGVAFLNRPYTPAAMALQLANLGFTGTHRLGIRGAAQQHEASLARLQHLH